MLIALQIIGGLLLLVAGGESLVRGAVSVANKLGISVIIIGLTIVAMGTSAPEMVISILATMEGHPDIALGNVIGSNIANILLVLGLTALVYPVATNPDVTKRDGILMVMVSVLLLIFMLGGQITRLEGLIFLGVLVAYLFTMFIRARRDSSPEIIEEFEEETSFNYKWPWAVVMIGAGFVLLVVGADIMVTGAAEFARIFGVSEAVIGSTIVAIGTSAPELVTCVVAAYRKHSDIAVGNIVGSNLFNIIAVLGVAATSVPMDVNEQFLKADIWIMLAASTLLIPLMLSGKRISRTEGGVMFAWYLFYIGYQYTIAAGMEF
jgi:cation:H+ antiporter